jgi:PST family polysaccharide transporter
LTLRRRLARAAAWSAAGTWSRITISFGTFVALAKLLGPEILGLGTMVASVVALLEVFLGIGILESIIQRGQLEPGHTNSMFWVLQAASLLLVLLTCLAAPGVAAYYGEPVLAELIPWAMLTPYLWAWAGVPDAILRRNLRFRPLAAAAICAEIAGSAVGISMAVAGYGVWSLIGLQVANAGARALVTWHAAGWVPNGLPSRRHVSELMGFNLSLITSRLFLLLERSLPALIVGPTLGSAALGNYSIARRFVQLLAELVMSPLQAVAVPAFAHLGAQTERVRELLSTTTRLSGAIALPVFGGVLLTAAEFVPALLGAQWIGAVAPLQILSLLGIRLSSSWFNHALIRGLGYPQLHSLVTALTAGLGAILMLAAVRFGTSGVAVAAVVASYATWPLGAYAVRRLAGVAIREQLAPFLAPAAATLGMACAVTLWQQVLPPSVSVFWKLASSVAVGILGYGLAMLWLATGTLREIARMAGELRN